MKKKWEKRKQKIRGLFNKFPDFFVHAFKIVVDSWKFSLLLLYILWDDWPIFMISASNKQLQQELEYTLLKPGCHSWWISKMQTGRDDTLEERYAIKFFFKLGKNATETYGMLQTAFRPSCIEWHKRFKEARESVRDDDRCWWSKEVNTPEVIGQMVRVRVTMLRFSGSSGRDSIGRGQHSSNRVSGISTRTIHQSITPSLSQTIWPRWGSRQFLSLPIVETLLPVTFAYSSEAVVMRQLRRWKRLWRRSLTRSHKRTSMGPSTSCWNGTTSALQPEEITLKGTVKWYSSFLRATELGFYLQMQFSVPSWGVSLHELHVCTINKGAHTKKVWKLI